MKRNEVDKYLTLCSQFYLERLTPGNILTRDKGKYDQLIKIAKHCFQDDDHYKFAEFLQESQYLINLWTAHLLLELGNPPKDLVTDAMRVIMDYSSSPLAENVAMEETEWLDSIGFKFQ